jgi:transcriptional regulator with XRE-family HTH domain
MIRGSAQRCERSGDAEGGSRQSLAAAANVSQSTVSRVERGHLDQLPTSTIRRVMAALDLRVEVRVRWRGGELDRLLDRAHAALGESVVQSLLARGWQVRREVSFSRYGERGVIDILAFHPSSSSLLSIELKTVLLDLQEPMAGVDRKLRLAPEVARSLGWRATSVSGLVVVSDGRTNRRRVAEHRRPLRAAFPTDGRQLRSWLRLPSGAVRGLIFWPRTHRQNARPQSSRQRRAS